MKRLNSLYYSVRLQALLEQAVGAGTTLVVAPMGYGKTLAMQYFLQGRQQRGAIVLRQSIYGAAGEAFWQGACRVWQGTELGEVLAQQQQPADANARALVLELFARLLPESEVYWFIDDLHLLQDKSVIDLLYALSKAGFANLHLLLASRGQIFSNARILSLGRQVLCLDKQDLALSRSELAEYSVKCGLELSSKVLDALHEACEGWFSVTYLNFLSYAKNRQLLLDTNSVYEMIADVLLKPLPQRQQRLLLLMGQTEEFTPQQVAFAYVAPCEEDIRSLLEYNALIIPLANGNLRCHHMLKQATRRAFSLLDVQEQQQYFRRLGKWYVQQENYEEALDWLYLGQDYAGLLEAVQQLRDWSMRQTHKQNLVAWLKSCPQEILWQHPQAVLIIMRRMFSLNMTREMLQVKEWYVTALERNTSLSQKERDNYYGELEVILSFLAYNSITGMSRHHRRAYELLSGAPQTLSKQGVWTFGAPSVLGLYLRADSTLQQTLAEMYDCMPPYYRLSNWHGAGAAELTEAEAHLLRGELDLVDSCLEKAGYMAQKHKQECIAICCDFISMQKDIFLGRRSEKAQRYSLREWSFSPEMQSMLLNTADMCTGFYYALLGQADKIPAWLTSAEEQATAVLYPARPCYDYILAQCLLAQERYTDVLVRQADWENDCRLYSNYMCRLYLSVQRAAAYAGRNEQQKAAAALNQALAMTAHDELVLPFAQNIVLLQPLLEQQGESSALAAKALALGTSFKKGREQILGNGRALDALKELSAQELEIARLAALRHTNREIAAMMALSEGTIKQYLNRIFSKLQIDASSKNKRYQLKQYFFDLQQPK